MRGKQAIDVTKIRRDRRWWSPVPSVAFVGWPGTTSKRCVRNKGDKGSTVGIVRAAFCGEKGEIGLQVTCSGGLELAIAAHHERRYGWRFLGSTVGAAAPIVAHVRVPSTSRGLGPGSNFEWGLVVIMRELYDAAGRQGAPAAPHDGPWYH